MGVPSNPPVTVITRKETIMGLASTRVTLLKADNTAPQAPDHPHAGTDEQPCPYHH